MFCKNINIDVSLKELRNTYLDHFNIPPSRNSDVKPIQDRGFAIAAKNIKWNVQELETKLNISFHTSRIFITSPGKYFPIHKDCVSNIKTFREWAINIPLFNCDEGYNTWFLDREEYKDYQEYMGDGASAVGLLHPNPKLSYREKLDCVKLLRTDIFHGVDNKQNKDFRIVLSLRSNDNISWNDISKRIDQL